ncbi:hypothetical protein VKS41_004794 [Umbelopsis sp. WA50703]
MTLKRKFSGVQTASAQTTITPFSEQRYHMGAKQSTQAQPKRKKSSQQLQHPSSFQINVATPNASPQSQASLTKKPSSQGSLYSEKTFDRKQCMDWFEQYQDPDMLGTITPEGMTKFMNDLGVSLESVTVLVISWQLNASSMGYFAREEWMSGMENLNICSTPQLKEKIPEFERVLQDPVQFKELYRYTFGYVKNKDQKCMDVDIAVIMWKLLLGSQSPQVDPFIAFLNERQPVKVINRDQWQSFLEFATTVSEDFHDYDEMSAWPVLFDEFVEWKREQLDSMQS